MTGLCTSQPARSFGSVRGSVGSVSAMASDCTNAQVHHLFSASSLCIVNSALFARLVAQQHARYQVVAPLVNVSGTIPAGFDVACSLGAMLTGHAISTFSHFESAKDKKKTTECEKRARWRVGRSEGLRRWRESAGSERVDGQAHVQRVHFAVHVFISRCHMKRYCTASNVTTSCDGTV